MSVGVAHKIPGSLYIILGHTLRSKCPGGASGGEPGSASKSAEGARYELLVHSLSMLSVAGVGSDPRRQVWIHPIEAWHVVGSTCDVAFPLYCMTDVIIPGNERAKKLLTSILIISDNVAEWLRR